MPFFSHESPTKLPGNSCKFLPCFASRPPRRKLLCSLCRFLPVFGCFRQFSSSYQDESIPHSPDSNLDNKHVVIWEIQRRARKSTEPRQTNYPFAAWEFLIAPKGVISKNGGGADDDDDEASETFYSVRSFLSRYSSEGGLTMLKEGRGNTIWQEFQHCEGWPFGLCRQRGRVMLPPLPTSPTDSWTWRKRTPLVSKACRVKLMAEEQHLV